MKKFINSTLKKGIKYKKVYSQTCNTTISNPLNLINKPQSDKNIYEFLILQNNLEVLIISDKGKK
jgi:secreted Zn-dependent insulinase-like peptidase